MSRPRQIPAVIMRGGTSKGVFLRAEDLPPAGPGRDALVLDVMGSPDPMQIDGLGGTHSSTSKVMVVGPGVEPGIDVSYWFAQVGVDRPLVDWSGNCGNLTTAVGPFAVDAGIVTAVAPVATLRLRNENTGVVVRATVPVGDDGRAATDGDHEVAGVPTPGAPVATDYLDPAGGDRGALPTGSATELVDSIVVSLVDVTHPYAFAAAADLGLDLAGAAAPADLNTDPALLARLERLRGGCSVRLGAATSSSAAADEAPILPRLVLVGAAHGDDHDLAALGVSMGKVHHALPMTGALCLAGAAALTGTVPATLLSGSPGGRIRIRHPKGVVVLTAEVDTTVAPPEVRSVGVVRTARRLMSGEAHLRRAHG